MFLAQINTALAVDGSANFPVECKSSTKTVELLDCLQDQRDILQAVLAYEEVLAQIEKAKAERADAAHAPPSPAIEPETDSALMRANWFDENLQVYAIAGSPEQLTAYARLNGREFRLRKGDVIRLARVINVHSRGIDLSVSGFQLSIGLSGSVQEYE